MRSLNKRIEDLLCEINGDVQHGECFHDRKMLDSLLDNLSIAKGLAVLLYKENQKDVLQHEDFIY